jgi:hypothetical protein
MLDRAWAKRAICLLAMGWSSLAPAGGGWHYTIDQAREKQQANFCDSKKGAEEIAGIFHRFGPRTGYAALSTSSHCKVTVHSFTPRRILITVAISKGKPGAYMVRFVEVENDDGGVLYLVTTRDVVAE